MALLDDLLRKLQDAAIGTTGTNLFADFMPETPDEAVAIFSTGGAAPEFASGPDGSPVVRQPTVAVWVRAAQRDPVVAQSKAESIYQALVGVVNQTLAPSNEVYFRIEPVQEPFLLKLDEKERPIVACNYRIMRA